MEIHDTKKGFNDGYQMKANAPQLADKFSDIFRDFLKESDDGYFIGFVAGVEEREKEMPELKRRNYRLPPTKYQQKLPQKDKDKDREI